MSTFFRPYVQGEGGKLYLNKLIKSLVKTSELFEAAASPQNSADFLMQKDLGSILQRVRTSPNLGLVLEDIQIAWIVLS